MRKILLALLLAFCTLGASFAQNHGPADRQDGRPPKFNKEEFMKIKCNEMADNLALIGDKRESFIKMYGDFTKEINELARTRVRPGECKTEEEVEAAILKSFEVSEKILDIRKNYYAKFKTILMPSQIQLMYQNEFFKGHHFNDAPGAMPPPPMEGNGEGSPRPL